MNVNPL